jgi:hypothetical protein
VQFYCGSHQHIQAYAERRAAIIDRTDYLRTVLDALRAPASRFPWSPARAPARSQSMPLGVFTELQVGSYIFLDREYLDCELEGALRIGIVRRCHGGQREHPGIA